MGRMALTTAPRTRGRGNVTKPQFPAVDLHRAKLLPDLGLYEKGLAAAPTYLEGESLSVLFRSYAKAIHRNQAHRDSDHLGSDHAG
jgi:hypothetical protein